MSCSTCAGYHGQRAPAWTCLPFLLNHLNSVAAIVWPELPMPQHASTSWCLTLGLHRQYFHSQSLAPSCLSYMTQAAVCERGTRASITSLTPPCADLLCSADADRHHLRRCHGEHQALGHTECSPVHTQCPYSVSILSVSTAAPGACWRPEVYD
jgi:hypothetical protein